MVTSVLAAVKVIVVRRVVPLKAYCPIAMQESGIVKAVRAVAPSNALLPMLARVLSAWKVNVVRSAHP